MGRWALLAVLGTFGCSDATSRPKSFGPRDLGDHLQPPGGDDLALQSLKLDMGSAVDLATVADLAQAPPDLSQPISNEPPIYVHTASTLYTLNPDTFDITMIGDFNAGDEITDLAEKDDGSLVAVSRTGLYTVNSATGAATLVADTLFQDVNALTYLSDGRLLAADIPGNVYQLSFSINPPFTFTSVNQIGSYGSSQTTAGDLVSVDDGTTWGLANGGGAATVTNDQLMIVNNVNGAGTQKGATGFGTLWGCAYSRHRILAVSSLGEVIEINPATGAGVLKKTHAGVSFYGAASNPTVLQ